MQYDFASMVGDGLAIGPGYAVGDLQISQGWASSLDAIAPGFTDAVQSQAGSEGVPWWQTAMQAMTTLVMTDYQRRLLNVQLERARAGLPPLDASQYGVGVNVQAGIAPDMMKMLLLGGAALVAVLLLARR